MISSIKQYKSGKSMVNIDRLVPNELYKPQSYCKESLDLIFDYNLSDDYDFKLLISSYSKIELLEESNIYKRELIKLWEHQFNIKFSNFWNVYYGINKSRIKKAEAFNQSPIDNWDQRLGIEKKLTDPMDFRIALLERSGLSANTDVVRKEGVSSSGDIVENSTLNAMRSPFLTKSADEYHKKNVDENGNINMVEKSTEISQAPDPHLLEFLYGNDEDSKQKKESIINKKKIEEIEILVNKESKKRKKKKNKDIDETEEVTLDRLATVNLDDFYTYSKPTTYTHEFYTEAFKKSMKGPDENEDIDKFFFDKKNSLEVNERQNIIVIHEGDSSKYQLAYEVSRRQEISGKQNVDSKDKMPIIKTTPTKPKLSEIEAKREALKELKNEVEYKKQLQKLNAKNNKIIQKRAKQTIKEEQKEERQRNALNKKSIKEFSKISSIENEIKLNKLIGKKSGISGKYKGGLRKSNYKNKTVDEQKIMVDIDAKLIEAQNAITDMDISLNKDNND